MYREHYRLQLKPFEIDPDPKFIWIGETHQAAFDTFRTAILENEGIVYLAGEPGSGKTTFLSGVACFLDHPFQCVQISDPSLNEIDFFRPLADAFGFENSSNRREDVFAYLRRFADEPSENSKRVVLLIDDAHRLGLKPLRQLRLLANLTKEGRSPIHIVCAGQSPCERLLPENHAFSPTVAMQYTLQPLTETETADYIGHRLQVAGAKTEVFTSSAIVEIFRLSAGIPRLINIICDNAMQSGYARGAPTIGPGIVLDSYGPGHRLIHEICELDKELSAQRPTRLPAPRSGPALAIGDPASLKHRPPATSPGRWQVLLKRLGLKPLTVKGALAVPISVFILLGIFAHFYFPSEDDDPLFRQVQIHSEQVPGRQTILQIETPFRDPSGIKGVAPVAEIQKHEVRVDRQPGLTVPSNEDRGPAPEINRLQDQLRFLLQQLQTAFDATAQLEQRIQAIEKDLHAEKDSQTKRIAEAFSKELEIQELRQKLETFESQQLALEEEVKKIRNVHAQLQTQLVDLRIQKSPPPASADTLRTPLKPKRTVVRPEKREPVQPAPTDIMDFFLKEKMQ
jgi:type II secretory pathway predicted ATPase ExeA